MKLAVIFSVLLVQTSASFFSEFKSSVSSVGSSIGQLITETAVDLKDTFDCTVFAVRIAFTGASTIPGYEKCQTYATPLAPSKPVQVIITPIGIPISTEGSTTRQPTKNEMRSLKTTSRNNTNDGSEISNKQSRKSDLLDETRIIENLSKKVERKFEDLSKHMKDDLTKIEREQKQLSTEKVLKEIDKMLQEEAVYKNKTGSEIRDISHKITAQWNKNNSYKIDFKEEMKLALAKLENSKNQTNVERELKMWKEEELKELNDIRNILKNQEANKVINKRTVPTISIKPTETIPSTTQTIPSTPMTSTQQRPTSKITKKRHARRKRPKSTRPSTSTKAPSIRPTNGFDSLETRDKAALDQALKLVHSSKRSAAIMASVLKNKESGTSIFET